MLELEAQDWRVRLDPEKGARFASAEWRGIPVLAPWPESGGGAGGCFVMAPFANRIVGGRFRFEGEEFATPMNRPAEGLAIHGPSRDRPWRVAAAEPDLAVLFQEIDEPEIPWRYRIALEVGLSPEGLSLGLSLINLGDRRLPFGIGLHPWFPREPGTRLSFSAQGVHLPDARNLPLPETRAWPGFDPASTLALDDLPPLDGCFSGWAPPSARILQPQSGLLLDLTAEGAFRLLHVFTPEGRPLFCAEPVSHLPDAVNRPGLDPFGPMTPLGPGDEISGVMRLKASPAVSPDEA